MNVGTLRRWVAGLMMALGLSLALPSIGQAQRPSPNDAGQFGEPEEAPVSSEGDPLYGYIAMFFLAGGAIFIICKSARR